MLGTGTRLLFETRLLLKHYLRLPACTRDQAIIWDPANCISSFMVCLYWHLAVCAYVGVTLTESSDEKAWPGYTCCLHWFTYWLQGTVVFQFVIHVCTEALKLVSYTRCLHILHDYHWKRCVYIAAKEVMFLLDFVCLSICLCVSKITQKVMDGSFWNFDVMSGMAHTTSDSILGGDPEGILDSGSLWIFRYHCFQWGIRETAAKLKMVLPPSKQHCLGGGVRALTAF